MLRVITLAACCLSFVGCGSGSSTPDNTGDVETNAPEAVNVASNSEESEQESEQESEIDNLSMDQSHESQLDTIGAQQEVIAPNCNPCVVDGGLNFSHPLVTENFDGFSNPQHGFAASLKEGRVIVESENDRIRSGSSSIRLHIHPNDCGRTIDPQGWDDCAVGNERVDVSESTPHEGDSYYGFSIMLDSDFSQLPAQPDFAHSGINLYQWFQFNSGACFNLQYNTRDKNLVMDYRCNNGVYDPQGTTYTVIAEGDIFDVWHEFVVYAKWSVGDGIFKLLHNGREVIDFNGDTIVSAGANQVIQSAAIYRFGTGEGRPASFHFTTPSTMWIDDLVRTNDTDVLLNRYDFEPSLLP